MKRCLSLLLLGAALALTLAGCGAKKDVLTEPPQLTVTNAQGVNVTAMGGIYDWDYDLGNGQRSGAIACGMHPLDETLRDSTPALPISNLVSLASYYTATLDFGGHAPQFVSVRFWNELCWGDTEAKAEPMTADQQGDGTYGLVLSPSIGVYAVDASWDTEDYKGTATYTFCTKAAGAEELPYSKTYSFGGEAPVKSLDISWLSGGVSVEALGQIGGITVVERSDRMLAEDETLTFRLDADSDGHTLHIGFMKSDRFDGEKYLTVYVPWELVKDGLLEEVDIETTSAYAHVSADAARKIDISTLSGDARVMCASCPEVEIETTSGNAGVVEGTWQSVSVSTTSGAVELAGDAEEVEIETTSGAAELNGRFGSADFSSVGGGLTLYAKSALRLDAKTTSGDLTIYLPEPDGFTLAHETTSGALESALTDREGTMLACGDRSTHYTVPALEGGGMSELTVSAVSGGLTIESWRF